MLSKYSILNSSIIFFNTLLIYIQKIVVEFLRLKNIKKY